MDALQFEVSRCRLCADAGYLPEARPIWRGKGAVSAPMLIVGQAPARGGADLEKPFMGAAGRTLSAWLEIAGLPPYAHHDPDLAFVTAVTRCFPGKSAAGKGDRMPSGAEVALCRPWLDAELALVRPRVVVLLGRLAVSRLIGPVPLSDVIGNVATVEVGGRDVPAIALPHPSGVSRWLNLPENRERHRMALIELGRLLGTLPMISDGDGGDGT